jgi:hypothetical protein
MGLSIEWIDGGAFASQEDTERARKAAYESLHKADVYPWDYEAAHHLADMAREGEAAWGELASAWRDAEDAANIAATAGWKDPNAGAVRLRGWGR